MEVSLRSTALWAATVLAVGSVPALGAAKKDTHGGPPSGGGLVKLTSPTPRTPLEHNNRGVELGSKGLWPDAIREHEEALQADSDNKEFRTNLSAAQLRFGDVLANKHDYSAAIKQYRGALYVDPDNAPADEHLSASLRAIKKNPDDINVRMRMGEDAELSGDYETAIVEYRKCIKMRDDGPNYARLGRVFLKAGKVVDGFDELKTAVGKGWETKDKLELGACHRQLGDILAKYADIAFRQGRKMEGMQRLLNAGIEYRRAVTINTSDADAARSLVKVAREAVAFKPSYDNHMTLGGAYQLVGDFQHAKMEYEECGKLNPNAADLATARASYRLALDGRSAATSQEDSGKASDNATKSEPPTEDGTVKKLMCYAEIEGKLRSGDIDGAQKQSEEILKKDDKQGHAWLLLGNAQEKKGELDKAAVSYRMAMLLKDPDGAAALRGVDTSRVQPLLKEADKAMSENNLEAAAAALRQAVQMAHELPDLHRRYAEVLRKLGNNADADLELQKVKELEK